MLYTFCWSRELSRFDRDQSFPEKKGYNPDVKLEYVDEKGRLLSTKEVRTYVKKFYMAVCTFNIYWVSN